MRLCPLLIIRFDTGTQMTLQSRYEREVRFGGYNTISVTIYLAHDRSLF